MKNPTDKDLLEQIQKILNPTGPHSPHPNLTPVPGSEKEQHKPKEKKAGFADRIGGLLPEGSAIGKHLSEHANAYDLAGLGVLAAPSAVELAQESRKPKEERRGIGKHLAEIGGLGLIAAPVAASAMGFKHAAATNLKPAKGLKRVGELLTGSRARKLDKRVEHIDARHERVKDLQDDTLRALRKRREGRLPHPSEIKEDYSAIDRTSKAREKHIDAKYETLHKSDSEKFKVLGARASAGTLAATGAAAYAEHKKEKKAEAFFDELQKLGMVSDDEAARALQSLQDLEQNKPSAKQTLGYMGIGAAATPIMHMAGNAIRGRPLLGDVDALKNLAGHARLMHMARDAGAQAFKGGVGGTVVSIGQQQLDRHHNMGKLKEYVSQADAEKTAGFLDSAKKLLLTDVGGPKGILQPAGQAVQNAAPKMKKPGDDFKAWQAKRMAKTGGAPPPLPAGALKPKANPMADALFAGMKASKANPMPSVLPKTAGAPMMPVPKMRGLAGSGTPAMPMPKPAMPKNNGMGMLG